MIEDPGKPVIEVTFTVALPKELEEEIRARWSEERRSFDLTGIFHMRWRFENRIERSILQFLKLLKIPLILNPYFTMTTIPEDWPEANETFPRGDEPDGG